MISRTMADAINEQINAELRSAYLYLAMSLDADSKALKGVANWFFVQWMEEQDHARIFQKYMVDQDAKVELKQIDIVPTTWESPLQMFQEALEHEKEVTRMINELVTLAFKECDWASLSRLQWFVDEQIEEELNVREQIDLFSRVKEYSETLSPLDNLLLCRQYTPSGPLAE